MGSRTAVEGAAESALTVVVLWEGAVTVGVTADREGLAQQCKYSKPRPKSGSVHCACARDEQPAHFHDLCRRETCVPQVTQGTTRPGMCSRGGCVHR